MIKLIAMTLCALSLALPQLSQAAPQVVVSLKPLHSLVSNLMQGVGEAKLLIDDGGSPHGYSLRPSQAKMLSQADLIIWVGPELETFMVKPLTTLAKKTSQLALSEHLSAQMLPAQQGGVWDSHNHNHVEHAEPVEDSLDHEQHATEDHGPLDQHIWLSPHMAKLIAAECTFALEQIDPANAAMYRSNLNKLQLQLKQFDQQLEQQLAPVKDVPYIVFHTAYQYFETAYKLNVVGSVTIDPERMPGAKRLSEIRDKIENLKAQCVFSEPQFESKLVSTLTEGLNVRSGILDPLGTELQAGPGCYFSLLQNLADNLIAGLKK
jgi:zinc transport system substrate-binding protein